MPDTTNPHATPAPATLEALRAAARIVHRSIAPTPLHAWPRLAARCGCEVHVKHENHTPTGAFKVRGGLVYFERLKQREPLVRQVVTATRGNHGQSVAYAAARTGLAARIHVPLGNSPDQNAAMRAFGAEVVEGGRDFDEAKHAAMQVARESGAHFVPSFHPDLVQGVASYALELFDAQPGLDAVYVGVGMGSGACGLIAARDALGLATEIVGVGAERASAYAQSYAARRVVNADSARTFADGIATREPNADAVAAICGGAARFVSVGEDAIADAVRAYFDDTHQVAEGAGAAPLAALLAERGRMAGKRVALVLSGGNIERARYFEILAGRTPAAP